MKLSNYFSRVIFSLILFTISTNTAIAETYTWVGDYSQNWLLPENWSPVGIPGGEDNVIIKSGEHYPELDGQVIAVKHIHIIDNGILAVKAEIGLSQLFCNTIKVQKHSTLINRSQISIWQTEESPFGNEWGALENYGIAVNIVTGDQFGETGLLTLASDINSAMTNAEYFHNAGRIQVNNAANHGINVNGQEAVFLNDGIINIQDAGTNGISTYAVESNYFTNNGIINIRKCNNDGIKMSMPFTNSATGVINIGQESEQIGGYGIRFTINLETNESDASFLNDGGIVRIDKTGNSAIASDGPVSVDVTNQNGGKILIGQGTGTIDGSGISLFNSSTLTNNSSTIKIAFTTLHGIEVTGGICSNEGNSLLEIKNTGGVGLRGIANTSMWNKDNAVIDIDDTGESGLLAAYDSSFKNVGNATLRIDDTGDPGLSIINSSTLENTGTSLMVISENGSSGIVSGLEYALYFQGSDNYFINYNCAEMLLYQPAQFTTDETNSLNNTGYIMFDTDGNFAGTTNVATNGVIAFKQENYYDGIGNLGMEVKPLVMEGCQIENALKIHHTADYTVGSTWYGDEAMTIEVGTYSQATNTFTITNLPSASASDLFFTAIKNDPNNNCNFVVLTSLIIEDYNEGEVVWTGEQSDNWHSSCNWIPRVIPGPEANILIPATATSPVLKNGLHAFGKSLHIEEGASLVINVANKLTLSDSESFVSGIENDGTLTNNGILIIKDCSTDILQNDGTFENSILGKIKLYGSGNQGIIQGASNASFTNEGLLEIYNIGSTAIKVGVGTFQNDGTILIGYQGENIVGNINFNGVEVSSAGTFNNGVGGSLKIKNLGNVGIANVFGKFNNDGTVEIDNTAFSGIWNIGLFNNDGTLRIGMNGAQGNITKFGISQGSQTFKNLENGIIEIDNTVLETISYYNGNFESSGYVYSHGQIAVAQFKFLRIKSGRFEILND